MHIFLLTELTAHLGIAVRIIRAWIHRKSHCNMVTGKSYKWLLGLSKCKSTDTFRGHLQDECNLQA